MSGPACILASGVFDLFHVGHLRYLQYARAQGDPGISSTDIAAQLRGSRR